MPAYAQHQRTVRPRERGFALAAVAVVQLALGFAILTGLRVPMIRTADVVQRLIDVALPKPPPPPTPPPAPVRPAAKPAPASSPAPKTEPKPLGGSPGPQPAHAPPSVEPIVTVRPNAAPSGGGSGTGPALGSGAGGGTGGRGYGAGERGGTDLEQIAGEFLPSDYPPDLGRAGVGGRVSVTFTVLPNGRVTGCRVTRSSRVPQLDALTCRIIEQRFRFRPSTDRYGRPVADEADLDQDWIPPRDRY
jgi:protein TonB